MNSLPLGFAQQVLDLQVKLQQEQSLQLMQILSQMYRIAVDYYINTDSKKAMYFQKKLNTLVVKSLQTPLQNNQPNHKKSDLNTKIKKQIHQYHQCQKTYLKSLVQNNQKIQKKIKKHVQDDLIKQQQNLKNRMLRRIKSSEKL